MPILHDCQEWCDCFQCMDKSYYKILVCPSMVNLVSVHGV